MSKNIPRWLYITILMYVLIFSTASIVRHNLFYSGWDIGVNEQVIWNSINEKYNYNDEFGMNQFGVHINAINIFIIPLYYIFPNTYLLFILQSVATIISVLPLYQISKRHLKEKCANIIVLLFCLNPLLWHMNLEDFHPIMFGIPIFLTLINFIELKKWNFVYIFSFLLLSVKEDFSLIIIFLGIYLILKKQKQGLKLVFIGLIWLLITTEVIVPMFSEDKYSFFSGRYNYLGNNIIEIGKNIITHPLEVITHTPIKYKIVYIITISSFFIILPYFSLFSIVGLPIILSSILSTDSFQMCASSHHNAMIIPIFFVSTIFALKKLKKIKLKKIISYLVIINVLLTVIYGILPFIMNDNWANEKLSFRDSAIEQRCFKNEFKFRKNSQHPTQKFYKEVNEIIKQIPKEATVFTSQHILPHIIKTRSTVTGTFHEYYDRDYVIIDKTDVFNTKEFIIEEELQATRYKLLFEKENKLFVFKKIITKKIGT